MYVDKVKSSYANNLAVSNSKFVVQFSVQLEKSCVLPLTGGLYQYSDNLASR